MAVTQFTGKNHYTFCIIFTKYLLVGVLNIFLMIKTWRKIRGKNLPLQGKRGGGNKSMNVRS
jgi:hypothetical protein